MQEAKEAPKEKLWRINDRKAQKSGPCKSIYWAQEKKTTESLIRDPNRGKSWEQGNVYRGEWQNNKKHGFGNQVWSKGDKYEGDWLNGKRDGHGVFWVKKGKKMIKQYAGRWKNDKKWGLGVFFYEDRSRYEGNWVDGMRQGRGTLFMANGNVYVGDWNQDKQSGFGTLTTKDEDVYEGEWLNGKREGAGVYYYKSKNKIYDGEWVNDIPKCGVYTSASEYFDTSNSLSADKSKPKFLRDKADRLVRLRLADPDKVLATQIEEIQKERQAVRNLPYIELEKLFSPEGLDDLRRLFSSADETGTDKVSTVVLWDLFTKLGFTTTEEELNQVLLDLDKEAGDTICFMDFVKAAHLIDELKLAQEAAANGGSGELGEEEMLEGQE